MSEEKNKRKRIVLLCSDCFATRVLYHNISQVYFIDSIITETPLRGMALAKRRLKRLGFWKVSGQVLFSVIIVPFLQIFSKRRIKEIVSSYGMSNQPLPAENIVHFNSVNDAGCSVFLKQHNPEIVIVSGTRIISRELLESTNAVFINMHAGITPRYRGVHGGYWALVNNDPSHCGVTIHLVDKGIDTGEVLYQSVIQYTGRDNFVTYPYLQLGEGLSLLHKAIEDVLQGQHKPFRPSQEKGKVWYHPSLWQYLYYRVFKGKK